MTGEVRVRRRMLYSPVVRFENQQSGRRVTVVATVHIGPAAYYEQLRALIDEMESAGAVVCYESAGPVTNQEWAAAAAEERAAWDGERRAHLDHIEATRRYFGWADQWTALGNPASWRNADMAHLEFVRRAGPENLLIRQSHAEDFTGLRPDQREAFAAGVYAVGVRLAQFAWFGLLVRLGARLVGDAARRIDEAVFAERNSHALASLPADSDAVLVWGAGHLPGLAAGLRKAGYRRRDTSWVTVGRLPGIWPSVKAFATGMKAFWAALDTPGDRNLP